MSSRNRFILIGSILSLALLALAFMLRVPIGPDSADTPKKQDLRHVRIAQWGQEKYLVYLPLYIAMEKGFLSEEGLTADVTFSGNDNTTFAAVISGSADFGIGDPVFTAIARPNGFFGKVVASVVGRVALWGVARDSVKSISDPEGLAGLRIGTFPPPSTNFTLFTELTRTRKELKTTKVIPVAIGSELALIESKQADIVMQLEPGASLAEANGLRVVFSSPKQFGPFLFTGLTTSDKLIASDPQLAQKVVTAFERAVRYCHRDTAGAVAIAQRLFPALKPSVVEKAVTRMISEETLPTTTAVSTAGWDNAVRTRITVGDLKMTPELDSVIDNSFAIEAARRLDAGAH